MTDETPPKIIEPSKRGDYDYGTDDCGPLAWWRWCHQPGRDKGAYSVGRGYTSYHKKEKPVCNMRHCRGCPSESGIPEEDGGSRCRKPDPDWVGVWRYVQSLKGVKRWKWTGVLVKGLIESVMHWKALAARHGEVKE